MMPTSKGHAHSPDPRADRGTVAYRRAIFALLFAAIAVFMQLYAPQSLLPAIGREFGISGDWVSWVIGAATVAIAVGVAPWVRLSDRIGRIHALKISMIIALFVGAVIPLSSSLEALILMRFLQALAFAGLAGVAVVALSETIRPRALSIAVGVYIAGNTVGGLMGRVLSSVTADVLGWRGSLWIITGVAAVATLMFIFLIPPTATQLERGVSLANGLYSNLINPGIGSLVLLGFLIMGSFVSVYNYLAFRLESPPFSLPLSQVAWIYLAYLAATASAGWIWRIANRISVTGVMVGCLFALATGALIMLSYTLWVVIVGLVLYTAATFALHTLFTGLVPRRALGLPGASQAPALYMVGFYGGMTVVGWFGGVVFTLAGWWALMVLVLSIGVLSALIVLFSSRHER